MYRVRWGGLAIIAMGAALQCANASAVVYNLGSCSGCPAGPYGTITVTQIGVDTVSVSEQLAPNVFADTGAGAALGYTLSLAVTISSLSSGFTAAGSQTFAGFGTFGSSIDCTGCGNGTSPPTYNALSFTLTGTGLTTSSFLANSLGYVFASDIGIKDGSGNVIWTGNVGATGGGGGGGGGGQIPEPATYLLLGSGLIALPAVRRKIRG